MIHKHSVSAASRCALGDDQDLPGFQCSGDGGGGCRCGSRWRDAGCVQSPGSYQREPAKRPRLDVLPTKVCWLNAKHVFFSSSSFSSHLGDIHTVHVIFVASIHRLYIKQYRISLEVAKGINLDS